jgi:hypothetical protein
VMPAHDRRPVARHVCGGLERARGAAADIDEGLLAAVSFEVQNFVTAAVLDVRVRNISSHIASSEDDAWGARRLPRSGQRRRRRSPLRT